jgi:peptide chain release factor subunit 3
MLKIPAQYQSEKGSRTIWGKVESGTVSLRDKCYIQPGEDPCQVEEIKDSSGRLVPYARPGENVEVKFIMNREFINRGEVICLKDAPVPLTECIEAELQLLELLPYKPIFTKGYTCTIHLNTLEVGCEVIQIQKATIKEGDGQYTTVDKPKFVKSHAKAVVLIAFQRPICVAKYENGDRMGRFILRDENKTIAV